MKRLKKDWTDLAARSQVSEVGLDVDRAEMIRRYREEDRLTQQQIAKTIDLSGRRVGQLLLFYRFNSSGNGISTRISEYKFTQYWKQISDPKMLRGGTDLLDDDASDKEKEAFRKHREYESACFADIRKLVEAGKPPMKLPVMNQKLATASHGLPVNNCQS